MGAKTPKCRRQDNLFHSAFRLHGGLDWVAKKLFYLDANVRLCRCTTFSTTRSTYQILKRLWNSRVTVSALLLPSPRWCNTSDVVMKETITSLVYFRYACIQNNHVPSPHSTKAARFAICISPLHSTNNQLSFQIRHLTRRAILIPSNDTPAHIEWKALAGPLFHPKAQRVKCSATFT
jgi:hypothetical protein